MATKKETSKELNIYQRLLAITSEMKTVAKNLEIKTNPKANKGYKAVSEVDVLNAVKPLEEKYGVCSYPVEREIIEQEIIETKTQYGDKQQFYLRLKITYRFVNVDNPQEYVDIISYGDGIDTGDKATGKAITYADKYALMKIYKISTGDDPDQEPSVEVKSKKQKEDISKLIGDYNAIRSELEDYVDTRDMVFQNYVCEHAKVNSIDVENLSNDVSGLKRSISVLKQVLDKKKNEKHNEVIEPSLDDLINSAENLVTTNEILND